MDDFITLPSVITADAYLFAHDLPIDLLADLDRLAGTHGVPTVYAALNGLMDRRLTEAQLHYLIAANLFPSEPGIYAIYYQSVLSYLGSTTNLRSRLTKHREKLRRATGIALADCSCRCITHCGRTGALAAEAQLISHYRPEWNKLGFGSNAHGSGRPNQARSQWDDKFGGVT